MRKEVGDLVHQVDPLVVILDPDVDMHAADHQAIRGLTDLGPDPSYRGLRLWLWSRHWENGWVDAASTA